MLKFIIIMGILFLYFWPSLIAGDRRHPNAWPILVLNLFLGWTLIGWVAALIWSLTAIAKTTTAEPDPRPEWRKARDRWLGH